MHPTTLAPASGFSPWALLRREMSADISVDIMETTQTAVIEGIDLYINQAVKKGGLHPG